MPDLNLILGSDPNQPDLTVIVWTGAVVLIGTSGVGGGHLGHILHAKKEGMWYWGSCLGLRT